MTVLDDRIHTNLIDRHNSLSNALAVADKVHTLLPDGVILAGWRIDPGMVRGQMTAYPHCDVTTLAMVSLLSRMSGWSLIQEEPKYDSGQHLYYVHVAAVTEMDGVTVQIWSHLTANTDALVLGSGVAA